MTMYQRGWFAAKHGEAYSELAPQQWRAGWKAYYSNL
jgi:hypothetical protein